MKNYSEQDSSDTEEEHKELNTNAKLYNRETVTTFKYKKELKHSSFSGSISTLLFWRNCKTGSSNSRHFTV